jgi:hypothetical protein
MVAQVGYLVAGRSEGRVTLVAACTVHMETRSAGFLVEPQNQGQRFISGLASKPLGYDLSVVWRQNHWDGFSRFDLKTNGGGFSGLGVKTGSSVW